MKVTPYHSSVAMEMPERRSLSKSDARLGAVVVRPATVALVGIVVLAAWLHFYQIDQIGYANEYYTAAVESMLQSWHNFFFVAAEPGGSVTVDKPPLGLWIQAVSAFIFGVNGVAVVLPNIIAGLVSIGAIYAIVQKRYGEGAGLLAALALAVTPVAVATQRNNTMDGMLTLCLVLAAWAFLKATEEDKARYLWLGALLVGLGFNVKMLQAFLPLPAFYALYFFGSRQGWGRKLVHLALATVILVAVSLSWAVAVDLTPAGERPYVGSSETNSVLELIVGHNGLNRWLGRDAMSSGAMSGQAPPSPPAPDNVSPDDGNRQPPSPPGGGSSRSAREVGEEGVLRFFQAPLSKELSWLLPLALGAMLLLLLGSRLTLPLGPEHQTLLLWGGWLATGLIFFSFADFFHAYYLVILAPPLAVLVGSGAAALWWMWKSRPSRAVLIAVLICGATLAFQAYNAAQFVDGAPWLIPAILLAFAGGGVLLVTRKRRLAVTALGVLLLALMIAPSVWTYLTVEHTNDIHLPGAFDGSAVDRPSSREGVANLALVSYLERHTQETDYLIAVPSSMEGAELVLATGRPVLYMGGFSGGDSVVSAGDVTAMVEAGDLRYVMLGGERGVQREITRWVRKSCTPVEDLSLPARPGEHATPNLYHCDS